ncbi:hypothetical protein D3C71_1892510 [compost metagenome]
MTDHGTANSALVHVNPVLINSISLAIYVLLPMAMLIEKANKKTYKYLLLYPIFMLSWWPITFYAFFTQNNKQWSHTEHTRVIRLDEMKSKQVS